MICVAISALGVYILAQSEKHHEAARYLGRLKEAASDAYGWHNCRSGDDETIEPRAGA